MLALPTQQGFFEDSYRQIKKNNAREDKQLLTLRQHLHTFPGNTTN